MHRVLLVVVSGLAWLGIGVLGASGSGVAAQEPASVADQIATYVGADACQMCHRPQYEAWSTTKHARALTRLGGSDKASGQCIGCHVTGTREMIAAEGAVPSFPNVQCEACHGPGRAHVDAARTGQAATVKTTPIVEETCTRCHNDTSPHYNTFIFAAMTSLVHRVR